LESAGYTDLVGAFQGVGRVDDAYSYVFQGQWGYLDHALANATMVGQVTGAAFWHINSDEPPALDYNDWNNVANQTGDEFRSSDHDPVVIGLDLFDGSPDELIQNAIELLEAEYPTGDRFTDRMIEKAIGDLNDALEYWDGDAVTSHRYFIELTHAARFVALASTIGDLDDSVADEVLGLINLAAEPIA